MEKIAIYDLDRTVTRTGTYTPFLLFAARRRPWRLPLLTGFFLAMPAYALGLISRKTLKELGWLAALGNRVRPERMERLARRFARRVRERDLHAHVVERIAQDKAHGCTLVVATAAPDAYAGAIGDALGFDHVIATRQARGPRGETLPAISGENCYGAEKLRRIEEWLPHPRDGAEIRFYSDHPSDEPVLAWCDVPVAANPKARMRALARARGWRVLAAP